MGELKDWADKHSAFLVLSDGEEIKGIYRGYEVGKNMFGTDSVIYKIEIDGVIKDFRSSATRVAMSFDSIKEGEGVRIRREGMDRKTKYYVEEEGRATKREIKEVADTLKEEGIKE